MMAVQAQLLTPDRSGAVVDSGPSSGSNVEQSYPLIVSRLANEHRRQSKTSTVQDL